MVKEFLRNNDKLFYVGDRTIYLFEGKYFNKENRDDVIRQISEQFSDPDKEELVKNEGYVEIDNDFEGVIFLDGGEYYPDLDEFQLEYPFEGSLESMYKYSSDEKKNRRNDLDMYIDDFDKETQEKLKELLAVEIKETGHYDSQEIEEHVERGMSSKVSDLDEILTPEMQAVMDKGYVNIIRKSLIEYNMNEFGEDVSSDPDIKGLNTDSKIALAYTELGDMDEFNLQVTLDLEGNRLVSEVFNEDVYEVEYFNYGTLENVANDTQRYSFDNLITLEELDLDKLSGYEKDISASRKRQNKTPSNDIEL